MVVVVVAVVVMAVVRMSLLPSEAPQDMAAILAEMQAMWVELNALCQAPPNGGGGTSDPPNTTGGGDHPPNTIGGGDPPARGNV